MIAAKHTPGPWEMRRVTEVTGEYYTVSRIVRGKRVHLAMDSDGRRPMWYSADRARSAIAAATGEAP